MSASILASFASFCLTGFFTIYFFDYDLGLSFIVKTILFFAIIGNAFYFFYMEALTEVDPEMRARLNNLPSRWEWALRIINQTILFSLWFLLEWSPIAFGIGLVFLYGLYIVWDVITNEYKVNKGLFYNDILGAVITIVFVCVTIWAISGNGTFPVQSESEQNIFQPGVYDKMVVWGNCMAFYLVVPIIGLVRTKFVLLTTKKYWIRENLM